VVADRETRRLSFGSVATDYDRYRPPPPPQALDWLIPPGAQAILDLAAGTGVVTRELIGRAARVAAVEPDGRMRAVLAARCPEAEVLAGRGEDIPLPAASVDAVVISAAWHWLDPALAVPEITRVLRPGGRLGVIWVSRNMRVPWVAELNAFAGESREADRPADNGRRRREVAFPPGTPLSPPEERSVEFSVPMTKDQLVGLLGTYSGIITLEAAGACAARGCQAGRRNIRGDGNAAITRLGAAVFPRGSGARPAPGGCRSHPAAGRAW
jgi:SAM-dependent methyltransferase